MDHLSRAKDYIAKGDEFYAKAADEIIAARKEDPQLSNAEIGRQVGRSESWVGKLVRTRTNHPDSGSDPFSVDWEDSGRTSPSGTQKFLREASPENLDALMEDPQIAGRLHSAVERDRAKPLPPMSDNTPREPLHWMLTKLASLYHDHDRFIRDDGERCIALPAELRLAAAMVIETGERKMAKFKEALEAEDADVRAILLAEAMDARREMDKALDKILGGAA